MRKLATLVVLLSLLGCVSVQRVYVQQDRFGEFLDAFTGEVAKLRTGDPLDDATDVGSMVDDKAAERVVRWTAEAAGDGAEILLGGTRDGATVNPTVVANPLATASVVVHGSIGDSINYGYFVGNSVGDVRIGGSLTGAIDVSRMTPERF